MLLISCTPYRGQSHISKWRQTRCFESVITAFWTTLLEDIRDKFKLCLTSSPPSIPFGFLDQDLCWLAAVNSKFCVYSRGLTTTTMWGDTITSLSESYFMSNSVGKTTKTSSSKQVILQMHFICFSFQDMRSVKIWRDEFKAAENLLFTQAVARNGIVFWNCTGSQMRNHIPTLGTIWKFHVNIAYAQVTRSVVFNSCPNSR